VTDEEILEEALERFAKEARRKFMAGIREHNPDGSRGLARMTLEQKIQSCREEVIDLWFYLNAMEEKCRE
jgi:hypothetical protein